MTWQSWSLVRALSDKQCSSDPLPTQLLKANIDLLVRSSATFSAAWRRTIRGEVGCRTVIPILKQVSMDPQDVKSYCPISNLTVLSKLIERLVSKQLVKYLTENHLLPDRQSAYKRFHSTETAMLRVLSDMLLALDSGDYSDVDVA